MLAPKTYSVESVNGARCSMEGRAWQAGTASRAKRLVQYMMKDFVCACKREMGLSNEGDFPIQCQSFEMLMDNERMNDRQTGKMGKQDDVRRTGKVAIEQRQERTDLRFLIISTIEDIDIFGHCILSPGILVPNISLAGAHAYSSKWSLSSDQRK